MSAPDTNTPKHVSRHRPLLIGFGLAVLAAILVDQISANLGGETSEAPSGKTGTTGPGNHRPRLARPRPRGDGRALALRSRRARGIGGNSDTEALGMTKHHGPSIKDDGTNESLRDNGHDEARAAAIAIANARASDNRHPSRKGGKAPPCEEWTRDELLKRGRELDISCRSTLTKPELFAALRG